MSENHFTTRDKFFGGVAGCRRVEDLSAIPYRLGQLELFSDEEEQFMQREPQMKLAESIVEAAALDCL